MRRMGILFATLVALVAAQAQGQAVDNASEEPEERHLTPVLADWMTSVIIPVQDQVVVAASPVARGNAIVTMPFSYRHPLRLKSDLKEGPFTVVKAGAVGFRVPSFMGGSGDLNCVFNDEFKESFRYKLPICYMDALTGGLTNYVDVTSNVPGTGQKKNLPIRAPEVETVDRGVARPFSIEISVRKWTEKSVSVQWKSDGELVHFADMAIGSDGSANLLVHGKMVVLRRVGKSQDTSIEVFNLVYEP
jgi:hypothetical protein